MDLVSSTCFLHAVDIFCSCERIVHFYFCTVLLEGIALEVCIVQFQHLKFEDFTMLCFLNVTGKYNVILDESHFKDLLNQHTSPPPAMVTDDITFMLIFLCSKKIANLKSNIKIEEISSDLAAFLQHENCPCIYTRGKISKFCQ